MLNRKIRATSSKGFQDEDASRKNYGMANNIHETSLIVKSQIQQLAKLTTPNACTLHVQQLRRSNPKVLASCRRDKNSMVLTCSMPQGKSNSLTSPKSSPVAIALPACDTWPQLTSDLSEFFGHTPSTAGPRTLKFTKTIHLANSSHRFGSWLLFCNTLHWMLDSVF